MAKKHEEPEKNEKEPAAPEAAKQAEAPKQPEGSKQKAESKQPDALEQAKAAQAQEHDQFLRLAAEYDNFRKRTQREKDGIYQDAVADMVTAVLTLPDQPAAMTRPFPAAMRRRPVTANSRARTIISAQAG